MVWLLREKNNNQADGKMIYTIPIENMQWLLFKEEELCNIQNNFGNK